MGKLLSADEFRSGAQEGSVPQGTVIRLATSQPVAVEGAERTLRFCFSDATVDRAGDSIDAKGWKLDSFMSNPVALWAHDSSAPPIGKAANVAVVGKRLMGDIAFAPADVYEFADTIYKLTAGGYINAVSVGFNPLEYKFVESKDRPYGIDFLKQELLEISVCPVPCNPSALIQARSKGIDTRPVMEWAEKLLDQGGVVMVPRDFLEETFKAAKTPRTVRRQYLERSAPEVELVAGETVVPDVAETVDLVLTVDEARAALFGGEKVLSPAIEKAGRALSSANEAALRQAAEQCAQAAATHEKALDMHRVAAEHQKAAHDHLRDVLARHDAASQKPEPVNGDVEAAAEGETTKTAQPVEVVVETPPEPDPEEVRKALRESALELLRALRAS